jgi:hypothetical protein
MSPDGRTKWSAADDQQLLAMKDSGMTIRAIGKLLRRSEPAISSRLRHLAREARLAKLLRAREQLL